MNKQSPEYAAIASRFNDPAFGVPSQGALTIAALDRLIDNYALALQTILRLRTLWERHTTHNHNLMDEAFRRFVEEHAPRLDLKDPPHDTHTVWPGDPPPKVVNGTNASDEVIRRVVRTMVDRGELYIIRDEDSYCLATLPEVDRGGG